MRVRGDRGLIAGLVFLPVIGFVVAGAVVLGMQQSGDNATPVGAWQTADDFYHALAKHDPEKAASLTDNADAAEPALQDVVDKLPKGTKLVPQLGNVKRKDDHGSGKVTMNWNFGKGRKFQYRTQVTLAKDDTWQIHWTPKLIHPELRDGQHMAVVKRTDLAAVVDPDGKPLMTWKGQNAVETKPGRAKLLKPSMQQRVSKLGAPTTWSVAAVAGNKTAGYLDGKGPGQTKPLTVDLRVGIQDAAQGVVDKQHAPAALVAIQPSTGQLVAIAQNGAAFGPVALSGLYPPGKLMGVVQTAAGSPKASGKKLVKAADTLGVNADFNVPPLMTELGDVRADDAKLSPLGAAVMASTIASGKAVTPQLWPDMKTKVLTKYTPPDAATLTAIKNSLQPGRDGFGKAYDAKAPHGKTDGWYIGSHGDMAFALLIDGTGGAPAADKAANDFLSSLPAG